MDDLLDRLAAARAGLAATRPAVEAGAPWPLAETFDDSDEARWGPGEVLSHLAEMVPYWLGEIERVLAGDPEPVPFGRVATNPVRIALVERDRSVPPRELYDRIDGDLAALRPPLADAVAGRPRAARSPSEPWRADGRGDARQVHRRAPRGPRAAARGDPGRAGRPPRDVTLPELGSTLPEIVLRTAIVYVFLVLVLRVTGKREVGQMSILELIVILVISDAVQNSMVGENTSLWGGLVAVITLFVADNLLKFATRRSQRLQKALEGEPRLFVRDGRILTKALDEEGVDVDDVRAAARGAGIARLDDVRLAVLETDGSISIIAMDDSVHPTTDTRSEI